jgi:hypothetical protein
MFKCYLKTTKAQKNSNLIDSVEFEPTFIWWESGITVSQNWDRYYYIYLLLFHAFSNFPAKCTIKMETGNIFIYELHIHLNQPLKAWPLFQPPILRVSILIRATGWSGPASSTRGPRSRTSSLRRATSASCWQLGTFTSHFSSVDRLRPRGQFLILALRIKFDPRDIVGPQGWSYPIRAKTQQ